MRKRNVLTFVSGGHHKGNQEITQEQLEAFAIAARELEAAQETYREFYCEIRSALLAGATVEPGSRSAQLMPMLSTGRIIPQFKYSLLLVR